MDNIIRAVFCGSRYTTTKSVFQIDKGDVLQFVGLDLPEYYEVHFSNSKNDLAKRVIATGDSVVIPPEFMEHGKKEIFAWVYLTPEADVGYTPYQVTIPLNLRSDISDAEPDPEQDDIVEQAIAALNDGVARAETAADNAEQSADSAADAETNAAESARLAKLSEDNAALSEDNAKESETNAAASERNAAQSEQNAAESARRAKASADAADESRQGAQTAAEDAESAAREAKAAADNAERIERELPDTIADALREAKESGEFDGEDGANGVTYTPTVDAEGNISWTNDGGLPNPQPRNIMGPQGEKLTYADLTAADKADLIQGPIAEAQTEAVEAVEQKGEDVLAELQEYADLPEDVADLKSALSDIDDAVIGLTGTIVSLDYDKNIVPYSGYYTQNGELKVAYYSQRIRTKEGIRLEVGDLIEINQLTGVESYICFLEDGKSEYSGYSQSSTLIVSKPGVYYLSFKYQDNRSLTDETARELLKSFTFLRGTGNDAIKNGVNWAISSEITGKVNFFNANHLVNLRINTSTNTIIAVSGHHAAWVKLQPNKVYNLSLIKAANQDVEYGLFSSEPCAGLVGTNVVSLPYYDASYSGTFITTDTDYYLLIKYCLNSVSAEKELEILESITINIVNGEVSQSVIKKTENARHIRSSATDPLTLVHFSDLHADTNALTRIMAGVERLGDNVDDTICTGDIVSNTYTEIASWWNPSVLTCIGNHDTASYSGGVYDWTALSMADRDTYYIAPFEANWGITHTAGTSYYYKDYATQKVRLIVMDVMLYNDNGAEATAQTAWLENLLADAITNNFHVVIAIHAPHGGAAAKDCSFSKYGQTAMPTNQDCNTPQSVIDTVAAKITNGLKFVGYLVGHAHQDNIWDAENNGTQLMYCVTCAAVSQVAQWKNSDQYRCDTSDAFNIVTIDTQNTLVKIIRGGGADIDDHMRTRKAICFNYSTGQIVGEVL